MAHSQPPKLTARTDTNMTSKKTLTKSRVDAFPQLGKSGPKVRWIEMRVCDPSSNPFSRMSQIAPKRTSYRARNSRRSTWFLTRSPRSTKFLRTMPLNRTHPPIKALASEPGLSRSSLARPNVARNRKIRRFLKSYRSLTKSRLPR